MYPPIRRIYKIVIIGDDNSQKTKLRREFLGMGFNRDYKMTIGADFSILNLNFNSRSYILQIWEINEGKIFRRIREVYYQGASAAILVFNHQYRKSFLNLSKWITELYENNINQSLPMILIGTNSYDKNYVGIKEAKNFAQLLTEWSGYEVPYIHVDWTHNSHHLINDAFKQLCLNLDLHINNLTQKIELIINDILVNLTHEIRNKVMKQNKTISQSSSLLRDIELSSDLVKKIEASAKEFNISQTQLIQIIIENML